MRVCLDRKRGEVRNRDEEGGNLGSVVRIGACVSKYAGKTSLLTVQGGASVRRDRVSVTAGGG